MLQTLRPQSLGAVFNVLFRSHQNLWPTDEKVRAEGALDALPLCMAGCCEITGSLYQPPTCMLWRSQRIYTGLTSYDDV